MSADPGSRIYQAASLLWNARRRVAPLPALPPELMPADLAEAYAIQEAMVAMSGQPGVGYKIGASSRRAQEFLSVSEPFAGRVLADSLLEAPADLAASDYSFCLAEPEFAFRLGQGLPAGEGHYEIEQVAAAVADLHPALEIVTSAFGQDWVDVGGAALIADNGAHGALLLGPCCSDWRHLDLVTHAVALQVNGVEVGRGSGANALGNPLHALTWLANHLVDRGHALEAGELVTTGVVTDLAFLEAGDQAVADFDSLGQVAVRMT